MTKFPDLTKALPAVEPTRLSPQFWIVIFWLLLVLPTISLRGAHYEEGTVIALARGALEGGHWLEPDRYGVRFIERPVLMSWLLAALGSAFGSVDLWLARVLTAVIYLCSGWLVFALVRRYATPLAALFAAACLFVSPMLLQKVTTAEPDLLLTLLMSAALVVWWRGEEKGNTLIHGFAAGLLLAAAGLVKGPQPLAYFFLGIGVYLLLRWRWRSVAGFALAGVVATVIVGLWYAAVLHAGDVTIWVDHARVGRIFRLHVYLLGVLNFAVTVALEFLPAILLAIPAAIAAWRHSGDRRSDLILMLALYAAVTTLVLIWWPGARTRYAMPAVFAVAALAGLAFDRLRSERPALVNASLVILCGLALYKLVLNWLVMPLAPDLFDRTRAEGQAITAVMRNSDAPLHLSSAVDIDYNVLVHVSAPKHIVHDLAAAGAPPLWMIVTPDQERQLRAERPELRVVRRLSLRRMRGANLIEIISP